MFDFLVMAEREATSESKRKQSTCLLDHPLDDLLQVILLDEPLSIQVTYDNKFR